MSVTLVTGEVVGAGAAINVELGFIPMAVTVINVTDGTPMVDWFRFQTIRFDSGSDQIFAGMRIGGQTSGARATVEDVELLSGKWEDGNAAGILYVEDVSVTGTWQDDETINILPDTPRAIAAVTNAATVDGVIANNCVTTAAAVATATAATGVRAYLGTAAGARPGFTIGATLAASGKKLRYLAQRQDH
jgi:hypothetical protein